MPITNYFCQIWAVPRSVARLFITSTMDERGEYIKYCKNEGFIGGGQLLRRLIVIAFGSFVR